VLCVSAHDCVRLCVDETGLASIDGTFCVDLSGCVWRFLAGGFENETLFSKHGSKESNNLTKLLMTNGEILRSISIDLRRENSDFRLSLRKIDQIKPPSATNVRLGGDQYTYES
jgi:hypothetical protein